MFMEVASRPESCVIPMSNAIPIRLFDGTPPTGRTD